MSTETTKNVSEQAMSKKPKVHYYRDIEIETENTYEYDEHGWCKYDKWDNAIIRPGKEITATLTSICGAAGDEGTAQMTCDIEDGEIVTKVTPTEKIDMTFWTKDPDKVTCERCKKSLLKKTVEAL